MSTQNGLVQRLWNYCNVLRDDGLSYGDYLEQLTYLLFLKMADEQTKPPFSRPAVVPEGYDWPSLLERDGDELEVHYRHLLTSSGAEPGMLGRDLPQGAEPDSGPGEAAAADRRPDRPREWMILDADVKGDAYEGLLEKNAEDTKSGAGQYFTPRPLIRAIVEVMRPEPGHDDLRSGLRHRRLLPRGLRLRSPAQPPCSTQTRSDTSLRRAARLGDRRQHRSPVRDEPAPARHRRRGAESPIVVDDALQADPGERFDMVLTNPPFGRSRR